ncbi:hypothetical protein Anapl_07427 [Anas platyrhynchos]|uniref:Uncharacterized protein n=1 Tax=Anas platyrhynchos TaxID=8839 RepID=R0JGX1_ANAPL|nr:hypothetical protein Anapl_07427 [Anas platyrhynchos]
MQLACDAQHVRAEHSECDVHLQVGPHPGSCLTSATKVLGKALGRKRICDSFQDEQQGCNFLLCVSSWHTSRVAPGSTCAMQDATPRVDFPLLVPDHCTALLPLRAVIGVTTAFQVLCCRMRPCKCSLVVLLPSSALLITSPAKGGATSTESSPVLASLLQEEGGSYKSFITSVNPLQVSCVPEGLLNGTRYPLVCS